AAGLEAGVGKLLAQQFQLYAVLDGNRDRQGEAVHQAADRRSLFRHLDEELAGFSVGIETYCDVALMPSDIEFVRDGGALLGQAMTHGARRRVQILLKLSQCGAGALARLISR